MTKIERTTNWILEKLSSLHGFTVKDFEDNGDQLGHMLAHQEHWKVMQFTGLKDKTGKEIYELDYVRHEPTGELFLIIYEGYKFVGFNEDKQLYLELNQTDNLELITNIYEDSHQIKKNERN
jgi:hypothetical protein